MPRPSDRNPTERFTYLADVYARYRPGYPSAAVDFILERCSLRPGSHLADVGCGTGISSRLFASRGLNVIGIEPNGPMRTEAEKATHSNSELQVSYQQGTAESTGLPEATCDAVLAAQSFHWFDPEPTYREFRRILKPDGWVILVWNERDEADPFTLDYSEVIGQFPDTPRTESMRYTAGNTLFATTEFQDARKDLFANQQVVDEEGLIGRAFSASYAPREPEAVEQVTQKLRAVFRKHQNGGAVAIRYETAVYTAKVAG